MLRSKGSQKEPPGFSREQDGSLAETGNTGTEAAASLSLDDAFDILRNSRRRHVLQYVLASESGSADLGEVAEHIAALENDKPVSEITSTERKRVYVGLYQNHLPRMDAVGVIDFDSDRKRIRARDHARELQTYLHADSQNGRAGGRQWPVYNLIVAGCGGLALAAILLLDDPSVLNTALVTAAVVGCFLVLSLGQLYTEA